MDKTVSEKTDLRSLQLSELENLLTRAGYPKFRAGQLYQWLQQKGVTDILTGVSQSDFSGYPDCRDEFIKSLNVSLNLAMDYEFDIITPLMWIDKEETWELADKLGGFDLVRNMTLTCYNGIKGDGCGNCPACKLRKKGLDAYLARR